MCVCGFLGSCWFGREAYALFREAELTEAEDATKAAKMFMRFARMAPALAEVYGI